MHKLIAATVLCAFASLGYAQQSGPAPGVLQLFSCHLNTGQTVGDARTLLGDLARSIVEPRPGFTIFLWTPLRGATGYDYVWGATDADLVAMTQTLSEYYASDTSQALAPRFQAVNQRCDSAIALSEQIKAAPVPAVTANGAVDGVVETFACSLKPGQTLSNFRALLPTWREQWTKANAADFERYAGFLITPLRGGNADVDFGWIGGYPDLLTFGRMLNVGVTTPEIRQLGERFQQTATCRTAVWNHQWILRPQA
jgi:hypothetical protein